MRVVVIGGGHNGLVAAATLAKAGNKVTVLERRDRFGGVADGGLLHDTETLSADVIRSLELKYHGLELLEPAPVFVPSQEGEGLLLHRDPAQAASELGEDAEAYARWRAWLAKVLPFAKGQLNNATLDVRSSAEKMPLLLAGASFRRLGKKTIHELLRVGPSCVDDYLSEWFESPLLKCALAAPALHGTWMGTRSPTSTATLLLHEAQVGKEVVGGPAALVKALLACCEKAGVELKTNAEVTKIRVESGAAKGVDCADGSTLDADLVLSCVGPRKTLLELVSPEALPISTENHIQKVRLRGTLAKVSLSLTEPIDYACRPGLKPERAFLCEDPLDMERAFDAVKHRRMPTVVPLDVRQSDGAASVLIRCATIELEGGWTDERRAELTELALSGLERYVPNIRAIATVTETLTPADIADRYGLEGGHEMHGELALDQLGPMRPAMALSRYATSIQGLFCGSAGIHPGGGVSGRSGQLAARCCVSG